jgi:hypothetical protein
MQKTVPNMEIPEGRPGKKFETKQEIGNKKLPQAPGKIKWETLRNAASWQVPAPCCCNHSSNAPYNRLCF